MVHFTPNVGPDMGLALGLCLNCSHSLVFTYLSGLWPVGVCILELLSLGVFCVFESGFESE